MVPRAQSERSCAQCSSALVDGKSLTATRSSTSGRQRSACTEEIRIMCMKTEWGSYSSWSSLTATFRPIQCACASAWCAEKYSIEMNRGNTRKSRAHRHHFGPLLPRVGTGDKGRDHCETLASMNLNNDPDYAISAPGDASGSRP